MWILPFMVERTSIFWHEKLKNEKNNIKKNIENIKKKI
jgi:hypothetical protein